MKHNRLIVPPNQREYAWTDLEVRQLFQDFAKAIADNEPGYFLGTIVTIPRPDGTLEVVDGQQRYTYANQAALDLLGYSLKELLQLRVPDLMTSSPKVFRFKSGAVTGRAPVGGIWPSDHNGVTSVLKVPRDKCKKGKKGKKPKKCGKKKGKKKK